MSAPPYPPYPPYPPPLRARRDHTALVCLLIALASIVVALGVGGSASDKANSAALDRDAASASARDASSSASVAASLPSPQELRARFPLPTGAFTKPDLPPSGSFTFYFVRGLTFEQVKAFYEKAIPQTFPTLQCRFDDPVADVGEECPLRRDVDFAAVDVWFKADDLRPGEIFIRLDIDP